MNEQMNEGVYILYLISSFNISTTKPGGANSFSPRVENTTFCNNEGLVYQRKNVLLEEEGAGRRFHPYLPKEIREEEKRRSKTTRMCALISVC